MVFRLPFLLLIGLFVLFIGLFVALARPTFAQDWTSGQTPENAPGAAPLPPQVAPIELKIPALSVDADVVPVGPDEDGAMGVPSDPDTVVWWALGAGTGVPGNVVMAGHVNWAGRLRVFGLLYTLG